MNRSRVVASLLLVLCVAGAQTLADDAGQIRQSTEAFAKAFDQGDAQAIAALWTPDGKLVDAMGRVFKGRAEIEAAYKEFFAAHPGDKIKISVDSIQLLGEDAALEQGTASLEPADSRGTESGATYTAVHVRGDGKWMMAFVHEANAAAPASAATLNDLDWMVGTWTAEEYGATMTVECRWLPNNSFLERKFTLHTPDKLTTSGMMLIGVDPRTGGLASWNFNFDGSHAVAAWMPTPHGWAIHSVGLLPDGTETHAVNVITKLDDNAYAWRSMYRSVGLQQLPDVGEIVLRRAAPAKTTAAKN
jgi:uncharacterized protein (TIGR02246 family)